MLHQVILEKDKLEREKQKLKFLFKQKKVEVDELEQQINRISSTGKGFVQSKENSSFSSKSIFQILETP